MKKSELPSTLKRSPAKAQRTFIKAGGLGEDAVNASVQARLCGVCCARR